MPLFIFLFTIVFTNVLGLLVYKYLKLNFFITFNVVILIFTTIFASTMIKTGIGNLQVSLGTLLFASTFLAADAINFKEGPEKAKRMVLISTAFDIFYGVAATTIVNVFDVTSAMKTVLSGSLQITILGSIGYFLVQRVNIFIFNKIKMHRIVKAFVSTTVAIFLDAIFFWYVAMYKIIPFKQAWYNAFNNFLSLLIITSISTVLILITHRNK